MKNRILIAALLAGTMLAPLGVYAANSDTSNATMMTGDMGAQGTMIPADPNAVDEIAPEQPAAPVAAAATKWQDFGLLTNQATGALPISTFDDMAWVTVKSALEGLPRDSISPVQRALTRNALLSQYNTEEIDGKPSEADLLDLRLQLLLKAGSFEEIISYYDTIPEAERPAYLYPAAFTAMAGLGRFSLNCLELKVQGNNLADTSPQLADIRSYCGYLLKANAASGTAGGKAAMSPSAEISALQLVRSPAMQSAAKRFLADKSITTPVTLSEFGNLDLISAQAANIAKMVAYPAPTQTTKVAEKIPASHMAMLLEVPPDDDGQRFALFAAALKRGQMSVKEITTEYKLFAVGHKDKTFESAPLWEKLIIIKHRLNNAAKTEDQIKYINQALAEFPAAFSAYGELAVAPFLADIITLYPDMQLTKDQEKLVLRLMLEANQQPPIFGTVAQRALGLIAPPKDIYDLTDKLARLEAPASPLLDYARAYSQSAQTIAADRAIKKLSYEKLISLTEGSSYVMPSVDVGRLLISASDSLNAGTAVIGSLLTLRGQPGEQIHPAVLALIIELYKTVGYEQEAQQLLGEVLAALLARQ
jgi:hypothetical protein